MKPDRQIRRERQAAARDMMVQRDPAGDAAWRNLIKCLALVAAVVLLASACGVFRIGGNIEPAATIVEAGRR